MKTFCHLFTKCILIITLLTQSALSSGKKCKDVYELYNNTTFTVYDKSFQSFNGKLNYKLLVRNEVFDISHSDVPLFKNSLLLNVTINGHAQLIYNGKKISSYGDPGISMKSSFSEEPLLTEGIYFVFSKSSKNLDEIFSKLGNETKGNYAFTCASNTCSAFNSLNIGEKKLPISITPLSLANYLLKEKALGNNSFEVVTYLTEIDSILTFVKYNQFRYKMFPVLLSIWSTLLGITLLKIF
ncbi:MAG: hypothetical protein J0M15_00235 [Deltaproteobacteria bacterium]|nr:hypothetical protein [Deltaproteobacteria bacterium]